MLLFVLDNLCFIIVIENLSRYISDETSNRVCVGRLMEKAMAHHSSTLAWKIPWMEEPGGLPSMGLHRVGHD